MKSRNTNNEWNIHGGQCPLDIKQKNVTKYLQKRFRVHTSINSLRRDALNANCESGTVLDAGDLSVSQDVRVSHGSTLLSFLRSSSISVLSPRTGRALRTQKIANR